MKKLEVPAFHEACDCSECNNRLRSIFSELSKYEIELIDDSKKVISLKKGQIVYDEETYPKYLYCINQGKIKITQLGIDGKEQILSLASAGDVLGYRAILCGDKYSTTATAIEDSCLCALPINLFLSLIKKNENVAFKILQLFFVHTPFFLQS
jgi:CRP/FNR family transcriptional regulator